MKRIEKLSLNRLSKKELTFREMNKVKGGSSCPCGCCYAGLPGDHGHGGSSDFQNGNANCSIGIFYGDPWSYGCPNYNESYC